MSARQGGRSAFLEGRRPKLALSPASGVTLDKSFCFSDPGFPSLQNAVVGPAELKMAELHYQPWAMTFLVFRRERKNSHCVPKVALDFCCCCCYSDLACTPVPRMTPIPVGVGNLRAGMTCAPYPR